MKNDKYKIQNKHIYHGAKLTCVGSVSYQSSSAGQPSTSIFNFGDTYTLLKGMSTILGESYMLMGENTTCIEVSPEQIIGWHVGGDRVHQFIPTVLLSQKDIFQLLLQGDATGFI